jgi:hypothetical protein
VTLHSAELIRSISNLRGDDLGSVERATHIGFDALYIDLEESHVAIVNEVFST